MFAVGALAGLRTGEVVGLFHEDCDLAGRRLHVRRQVHDGRLGPLKDDDSRVVPIVDSLLPVLAAWKRTDRRGLMFPPLFPQRGGRPDLGRASTFIRQHTLNERLAQALEVCDLSEAGLTWYKCTRHTFASHWILDGRQMERLQVILGHEDITTTQQYAHLTPGFFSPEDLAALGVELEPPAAENE